MRGPQRAKPRIATTRAPCRRSRMTGFSLIELVVVLVVLAIVIALGAPAFAQWIQNSHIRNATESLTHGMLRARAEADAKARADKEAEAAKAENEAAAAGVGA